MYLSQHVAFYSTSKSHPGVERYLKNRKSHFFLRKQNKNKTEQHTKNILPQNSIFNRFVGGWGVKV